MRDRKKGFGFFPDKNSNFRYPQIGVVILEDNVEIGCGSTIDRGSHSNTIIGKNTYLDNQIHVAHNVKIGENCIIAGQVGFAGSSTLGNNIMIQDDCKIGLKGFGFIPIKEKNYKIPHIGIVIINDYVEIAS